MNFVSCRPTTSQSLSACDAGHGKPELSPWIETSLLYPPLPQSAYLHRQRASTPGDHRATACPRPGRPNQLLPGCSPPPSDAQQKLSRDDHLAIPRPILKALSPRLRAAAESPAAD